MIPIKPKFYIDNYMYANALGLTEDITDGNSNMIFNESESVLGDKQKAFESQGFFSLDPTALNFLNNPEQDDPALISFIDYKLKDGFSWSKIMGDSQKTYLALLGHNLKSHCINIGNPDHDSNTEMANYQPLINAPSELGVIFSNTNNINYSGWSLMEGASHNFIPDSNTTGMNGDVIRISVNQDSGQGSGKYLNCISFGTVYELQSPDTKLTMSREYPKQIKKKTLNGSEFTNTLMPRNPRWGKLNAWEIEHWLPMTFATTDVNITHKGIKQKTPARVGRRIYKLSFSGMSGATIYPDNENVSSMVAFPEMYEATHGDETLTTDNPDTPFDESTISYALRSLGEDDSFISQVWQKTLGGKLKFIFQANGDRFTPDQFMIAKFKDNSLKITRTSPTTHTISIIIEESF